MGDQLHEIVGIVGDLQHRWLLESDSADPDVYLPPYQAPRPSFAVLARTAASAEPPVAAIRQTIAKLNPAVPSDEMGISVVGAEHYATANGLRAVLA